MKTSAKPGALFFNPADPKFINDPYPTLQTLQENDPIHWSPLGFWFVTRFKDVQSLLNDERFAHEQQTRQEKKYGPNAMQHGSIRYIAHSILLQNPPKHTHLRKIMAPFFSRSSLEARRPRLQWAIDNAFKQILDAKKNTPNQSSIVEFDFIQDIAQPVLGHLICDILGIPESDRKPFVGKTCLSPRTLDPAPVPPQLRQELDAEVDQLTPYFEYLFKEKGYHPESDLISAMVAQLDAVERESVLRGSTTPPFTKSDLIDNCLFLFAAGQEVTKSLMGNALIDLYKHPNEWKQLSQHPSLSPQALQELARYSTALQMTHRIVAEPFEYHGHTFKKGDPVILSLAAANRDPSANEAPNRLNLQRTSVTHLAFGRGIHYCIGAHLGMFECQAVLEALFQTFDQSKIPLSINEHSIRWQQTITIRGPEQLQMRGQLKRTDKQKHQASVTTVAKVANESVHDQPLEIKPA